MSAVQDIIALENGEGTDDEQFAAMQRVINEGSGWRMQGSMGRSMMAAIEGGWCMLGCWRSTVLRFPTRASLT